MPYFCPRKFAAENEVMNMFNFKLTDAQLKQYGLSIITLRRKFEKQAMKKVDPDEYPNVNA